MENNVFFILYVLNYLFYSAGINKVQSTVMKTLRLSTLVNIYYS
jgi:hypothetical protein